MSARRIPRQGNGRPAYLANHPVWRVVRDSGGVWHALKPILGPGHIDGHFRTWSEAFAYADHMAQLGVKS